MNARCRRFTLLALSACLALAVHAQESPEAEALPEPSYYKPLRFETVTQEDGLSQTTVATILQDHQGYLWFGVEGGLNRYDGYDFKVYTGSLFDTTSLSSTLAFWNRQKPPVFVHLRRFLFYCVSSLRADMQ